MEKKLHKSDTDRKLGGVCAGIAETLDIDISVVRIVAFFLCVLYPVMLIVYFLLAVFLPSKKNCSNIHPQESEQPQTNAEPCANRSAFALWAFISSAFCVALGCAVCKGCGLTANIDSAIVFAMLAAGLYIFFSGLCESAQNENSKITKISIGAVISVMCISKALDKFALTFLPFNYLALSAFYFWPLLMVALGLTVIISNKKIATAVWVTIFILLVIFSIVSRILTVMGIY